MFKHKELEEDVGIIFRDQLLQDLWRTQARSSHSSHPHHSRVEKENSSEFERVWGPPAALWLHSLQGSCVLAWLLSHFHPTFAAPHKTLPLVQDTLRRCGASREVTNTGRTTSVPPTSSLHTASLVFYFFPLCFYTWGDVIPVGSAGQSQVSSGCVTEGTCHRQIF